MLKFFLKIIFSVGGAAALLFLPGCAHFDFSESPGAAEAAMDEVPGVMKTPPDVVTHGVVDGVGLVQTLGEYQRMQTPPPMMPTPGQ